LFLLNFRKPERMTSKIVMDSKNSSTIQLDTSLYSRQIGAFGFETMGKLIKMKILIIGLNGCGVEAGEFLSFIL
jgi:hypothetical protein